MSIFDRFRNPRAAKNVAIGYVDDFLRYVMNVKLGGEQDVWQLYRAVPWLGRGVNLIAQAVQDFPFEIQDQNGNVVDASADWKNTLGFTAGFQRLLYLVSSSLTLRGRAYVFPARNRFTVKELRYWNPDTVEPWLTEENGLEYFNRRSGLTSARIEKDALVYWWLPDPAVEVGPPLQYPAQNALNAAGVLFSLDDFFKSYAKRGLIKAFIAAVKGLAPTGGEQGKSQKEKLEDEFERTITGAANYGKVKVVNADAVTIVPVGEGLQEFKNVELTKEKREDIAVAIGIPMSILWSTEASGLGGSGVTKEDTYRFYKQTVLPNFNFIVGVANEQLFVPLGYRVVGKPETLDVFQEDEVQRAQALASVTTAINTDPAVARFAMKLLGYDLDDDQKAELDALIDDKAQRSQQMAELGARAQAQAPGPGGPGTASTPPMIDVTPAPKQLPPGPTAAEKAFREDLARWQRKVENRLSSGKGARVDFASKAIPGRVRARLRRGLLAAKTRAAVQNLFAEAGELPLPEHTGIMVAFAIPEAAAQKLVEALAPALPEDAEPSAADELHLTLAYLGETDAAAFTHDQVMAALKVFCAGEGPLVGTLGGAGKMNGTNDAGGSALYTLFDSPTLPGFRERLVATLTAVGAVPSQEHGFVPHVTLAYVPAEIQTIPVDVPAIENVAMTEIVLAWGGDWQALPLNTNAKAMGAQSSVTDRPFQGYRERLAGLSIPAHAPGQ